MHTHGSLASRGALALALTLLWPLALALTLLCPLGATAQLKEETATREVDLRQSPGARLPPLDKPLKLDSFRARYRYQIAGFLRLLRVNRHVRRCVDAQRMVAGEFHDRLDFTIEPGGKLKAFSVRRSKDQLQACLMPHVLTLRFPAFTGRTTYTLQVLVGSPGARLGRRPHAKPVSRYPVSTREERRAYSKAVFWVYSPWSMAISRCAEWVDQTMSFGYRVRLATAISRGGQPVSTKISVRGKLAGAAVDKLVPCVVPFLAGMRVPKHAGPGHFIYKHGTTTAGWGIR